MGEINGDFDYVQDEQGETAVEADLEENGAAYAKVKKGTVRSGEIGACICIGAYDPMEEVGYMAHIEGLGKGAEEIRRDVEVFTGLISLNQKIQGLDRVRFFLGGTNFKNPLNENENSEVNKEDIWDLGGQRLTAENMLRANSEYVEVEWGSQEDYFSELFLEPESQDVFSYNRNKTRK